MKIMPAIFFGGFLNIFLRCFLKGLNMSDKPLAIGLGAFFCAVGVGLLNCKMVIATIPLPVLVVGFGFLLISSAFWGGKHNPRETAEIIQFPGAKT